MKDKLKLLEDVKLFVLDMDGTFYLGDRIIDGSLEFLETVKNTGRNYIFFTNNSSKIPSVYVDKLAKMDCHVTEKDVMTSGDVTINYLNTHYKNKPVYLVGTPVLEQSFRAGGINLVNEAPELVVVAFDTTLTYEKLERACTFIREGAIFLATHLDINCPTEEGFIPDCGAMCALVSLSTGKEPKYLGKPFAETVEMVLDVTGYKRDEIAFVGDRLYTDVATGVKNGAKGFLVLTGETKLSDVENSDVEPDAIFFSLKDIADHLEQLTETV
ncbi:MAG: HAD-IIA family hydrolase [Angelakisella sp.]